MRPTGASPSRGNAPADLAAASPETIAQPYLLVLFPVPFYRDASGRRYLDPLWAKDLVEHTRYIDQLTLASRLSSSPVPANAVAMDDIEALRGVRCVELPDVRSLIDALKQLPRTWRLLWRACAEARLVHSGVAGWPLPEAWVLMPVLLFHRCLHYINVESAFWRLVPGEAVNRRQRLRAWITERLNRWCVGAADISSFTQEGYRRSLLHRHPERGHVVEASWVDANHILSASELAQLGGERLKKGPLRLVFAGRLTAAKGVDLLLDAVAAAIHGGLEIELDLFGDGPLGEACAARIAADPALVPRIRLRGSLPYDASFFEMLGHFHLLVVPTLSDEQPRIVFDAYARGLPVLASDTAGLRQCVEPGVTGWLFRSGDLQALVSTLASAAADRSALTAMGAACTARAAGLTHQEMHRKRWRLLVERFPELTRR